MKKPADEFLFDKADKGPIALWRRRDVPTERLPLSFPSPSPFSLIRFPSPFHPSYCPEACAEGLSEQHHTQCTTALCTVLIDPGRPMLN